MAFYHRLGEIPKKRHTMFHKPNGELYREQVMGTKGFSGIQSILYHHHPPTQVRSTKRVADVKPEYVEQADLKHQHFKTFDAPAGGDPVSGRTYLLGNSDVVLGVCVPTDEMNYFYRNADGDELLFVHQGEGELQTIFGTIPYCPGDYLVIPIGTTYRIEMKTPSRFLVIESQNEIVPPKRYRNEHGQLLEHSPFCERDIRVPERLDTHVEEGSFEVRVKRQSTLYSYMFDFHPFDVVGWDGYLYPYALSIHDFEPITGRIHQPPPVHQTFAGQNFVVCSFVPRLYDYHPQAIPAPYFHSNVESDEVLYYVDGNFMSRKGIYEGSITLHPMGIPHGPHPGKVEASIGKKETKELAVMLDTFKPLYVTKQALEIEDPDYMNSWLPPVSPE
ncbi:MULTISPECIES: homogentisate 1,2-dioxygenase [Brevibacillus]|jgi:homogentisate 1,2-dioxygenase|uniref:homogentisate 1,2-dioxygenase n=1 Tax=Brevibacillus TaxID=55080 RepID=UPI00057C22C7|nr:homogentisate 1,2-dioxygenase [Brevibacillus borstelensis]MBE5395658.1 homogentisate 1,2-dioxygenase [Brevibacillus borstelensis]MCC0567173.1 homogentisate 1,2-dioxygenase [Brevibacillus borstelensis]MCM3473634.1 homogentisate 1,2-dioxygenase [Brevibacillus borstelensis]MCM3561893.1 homogentisate 1,2-dioxygenase [Brevibacillus borstelensis]MCM3625450.1 homogentisate 1,2-dioxygenase [Brevibacillus borstelensis]